MEQCGWICSETWADDEEDKMDVASSTVTCSLGQNVDQGVGQLTWEGQQDRVSKTRFYLIGPGGNQASVSWTLRAT